MSSEFRLRELRCSDIDAERKTDIDVEKPSLAQGPRMAEDRGRWSGCGQTMPLAKPVEVLSRSIFLHYNSAVVTCCESGKRNINKERRALERVELGKCLALRISFGRTFARLPKFSFTHSLFAQTMVKTCAQLHRYENDGILVLGVGCTMWPKAQDFRRHGVTVRWLRAATRRHNNLHQF